MQYILDCVTTVLTAVLCFLMLLKKYDLNKKHILPRIIIIISAVLLKMLTVFLQVPPLNLFSTLLMCFSILFIAYKCQIRAVIIYTLIFLMLAFVSDALSVLIVSTFYNHTITETLGITDLVWHHHIWDWLLLIFLSRITALVVRKNDNIRAKWHEMLFYIFLLMFQIMFFALVSSEIQDFMSGNFLILIMSGFMMLDICIMYILHKISLLRESEQKVCLMQQQENLQLHMYQELRKKYNTTCEIAHDINRHIFSLKSLIALNPNEQAESYLSDLTRETDRLRPVIRNQNPMLEIILNTISDRCEKENIVLEMNVEDFSMKFMSDIDITTIFSNLFDNAIEACLEISKSQRKINVTLRLQMGLIALRITNSCKDSEENEFQFHRSTKANHSGIGLSNVKKSVEKYNGVFSVKQEKNQFCVSITFSENI